MPAHFTAATFRFLRELEENNDRAWWEQNKQRYVEDVRDPALAFIADFAGGLATISPHFVADARSSGGLADAALPRHPILCGQDSLQDQRRHPVPARGREGRARPRVLCTPRALAMLRRRRSVEPGDPGGRGDQESHRRRPVRLGQGRSRREVRTAPGHWATTRKTGSVGSRQG